MRPDVLAVTETVSVSVVVDFVDELRTSHPSLDVQFVVKVLPPGLVSEIDFDAGLLPPAVPEKDRDVGESAMLGPVPPPPPPPLPVVRFSVTVAAGV